MHVHGPSHRGRDMGRELTGSVQLQQVSQAVSALEGKVNLPTPLSLQS